jgi:hypothetical protein
LEKNRQYSASKGYTRGDDIVPQLVRAGVSTYWKQNGRLPSTKRTGRPAPNTSRTSASRTWLDRTKIVDRRGCSANFLSGRSAESREAALARRLDLLTRQVQRLERTNKVTMETLALFVRFFPDRHAAIATRRHGSYASGNQRYEGLIEALGQRLRKGRGLLDEIPEDVEPAPAGHVNGGGGA